MNVFLVLSFCLAVCYSAKGSKAPFIEPCREGDSKCLLRSAKAALPIISAGVPSLGIGSLDPLHLDHVETDNAGLHMEFKDTTIKGLSKSEVTKLERSGKHLELVLKCSLVMTGHYKMAGQLLLMPINGDGEYRIRIHDMVAKVNIEFGERQQGANTFWTIKEWKQTSTVQTGADFKFKNLFNGNKQLSDGLHDFANSNWKEIFQEVAPPIVEMTVGRIVGEIAKLFEGVPIKELTIN